jgi:hypothetical protein
MNFKNILTILLVTGVFIISCQNANKDADQDLTDPGKTEKPAATGTGSLVGSWEDQSEKALHFTLHADGTAQSDNMATLLYQQWSVRDNQLFMVAKMVGNRESYIDTMVYSIQKLNDNELILKRGDLTLEYKKLNRNKEAGQHVERTTLSDPKSKTVEGQLTLGHETRTFKPCGTDKTFWVADKTGKLQELYAKLTTGNKPYTPIFVEMEVKDKGKAKDGFPAGYESVYEVVNVLKARNISGKDCE